MHWIVGMVFFGQMTFVYENFESSYFNLTISFRTYWPNHLKSFTLKVVIFSYWCVTFTWEACCNLTNIYILGDWQGTLFSCTFIISSLAIIVGIPVEGWHWCPHSVVVKVFTLPKQKQNTCHVLVGNHNYVLLQLWLYHMGVSKNRDTPKWMVYNGKPY